MSTPCGNDTPQLNCGPGIPGKDGAPGTQMAIHATPEPAGANTLYGGWKIEVGPDPLNTGVPATILQTFYIPDGAPGTSRAIRVTAEAPGSHCTAGGYKIETGDDTDNDGIPDTNVVTSYVCNGIDGTNGATPTFVAGTATALAVGDPPTIDVTVIAANTYRIDIGVPAGATGAAGASASSDITVGLTPSACALPFIPDPTKLDDWLAGLAAMNCASANAPDTFKAKNTSKQIVTGSLVASSPYVFKIIFNDDSSSGMHDNGNNFLLHTWTAPSNQTKTFVLENVTVKDSSLDGSSTVTIKILKNSGGVTSLVASAAKTKTSVDSFGNTMTSSGGFVFDPLTITAAVLAGDEVYAVVSFVNASNSAEAFEIEPEARFSNY